MGGRRRWWVTAAVVALAVSGCGSSARTSGPYQAKAANAAGAVASAVSSDLLVLRAVDRGSVAAPYVSVATSQAEDDASSAASTFASIQPPTRGDERLRRRLLDSFDSALRALAEARIAGRRGEYPGVLAARSRLASSKARLLHIQGELA